MRSRYVAYAKKDINYLQKTVAPQSLSKFDMKATKEWAETAHFKGLKILSTEKGGSSDRKGVVEFMATYTQKGETFDHHEVARFRKDEKDRWFFVEGDSHVHREGDHHHHHHARIEPLVRASPKIGRNDPCSCGSGKKFKKCCGGAGQA